MALIDDYKTAIEADVTANPEATRQDVYRRMRPRSPHTFKQAFREMETAGTLTKTLVDRGYLQYVYNVATQTPPAASARALYV